MPLYVPETPNNREGPQAGESSKCLNGQSYGERRAKEAFWLPGIRGSEKDSDRAITPAVEAVHVPAHLAPPGSLQASSCTTLILNSHWGRAATGKKILASMHTWSLRSFPALRPCRLWPARLLCQGEGVLQVRILDCIGQYWLPCYISCCPSCQLPWVPGAARTPATQAAAPPSHLALTGADPSPPGQPQEQTPVDDPHAEVEIQPQLKPRGSVAKEEDPKPSTSCTSCRLNLHNQLGLCANGIYKRSLRAPTKENTLVLIAVDIGGKNTQE